MKNVAFNELNRLYYVHNRRNFPNMPEYARVKPNYTDKNTNGLTKCIIDYLRFQDFHVERTGNEGRVIDTRKTYSDILGHTKAFGSIKRIKGSGTRGTSDLKAIINGRFVAIEVKNETTKDRQSDAQKAYQKEVERCGGVYIIASSFLQFYHAINQYLGL